MTLISLLIALLVGLLSYSIGYNSYRIRRKRPAMRHREPGESKSGQLTR